MTDFDNIEHALRSREFFENAKKLELSEQAIDERIRNSLGEASYILKHLPIESMAGQKVLEVGAGLGIASAYLERRGVRVEALEPVDRGFQVNRPLLQLVRQTLRAQFVIHNCRVEDLPREKHGFYDWIFSHNVLEHMADIEKSMRTMRQLLKSQGRMIHSCPNYRVPYEPHYGVWLFPFFPWVTRCLSGKIRKNESEWRTLNFVTAGKIAWLASRIHCSVYFKKELMYEALNRFESDSVFAARQKGWPYLFYRWLKSLSLLGWVRVFPARWATPMIFYLEPRP